MIKRMFLDCETQEIPSCPGYFVSRGGRVFSTKKYGGTSWRELSIYYTHDGYPKVKIVDRGRLVHQLVAETFLGPRPEGREVCHSNGIKTDNRVENLRWDTRKNNIKDAIKQGTHNCLWRGSQHTSSKLKELDVRWIRYLRKAGVRAAELAEFYRIDLSQVYNIVNRKQWSHI